MRLDKFISSQKNELSRRQIKELCRKGKVCVNGRIVKNSDFQVDENNDSVTLDGEKINYARFLYIMLNKPAGYVCSTKEGASPTVLTLVPNELKRRGLFPAGRLDKDTEGLVLITDDGELAHRILSPAHHVDKKYYVELENPVEDSYKEKFAKGLEIDGGDVCLPAEITFTDNSRSCYVVLRQGMYHQIKRMFAALGNKVTYLKRISIGKLTLDENLALGECLVIMHKDVERFFNEV